MNNKRNTSTPTLIAWQAVNSPLKPNSQARYTQEEKDNAVNRYLQGEPVMKIAADTKISKATIHRWIAERKAEQEQPDPHVLTLKNFTTMERKIERLENVVNVLKTVNCTVKSPLKKRLYAAEPLVSSYSIPIICEALNIPKGTFYNHVYRNKRDNTWYAKRREALRLKIQEVYDDSRQIFGAAKIHAVLKNQGIKTSPETVRELMRDMGLITIRQSAKALYVEDQRKYKNHVEQNFDTKAPNEIWVSDVTYFKCNETQFYICVVIDLFSRKVISYKISLNNSTQLVKSTVRKAFESREPKTPLYCTRTEVVTIAQKLWLII